MSASHIKVAVTSTQPVIVEGLTAMLNRHTDRIEVVPLPRSVDQIQPDVVLFDVLALARGDGSDLDTLVKESGSVVFALGRELRPDLLSRALRQGAHGFFDLGVTEEELLKAVESGVTGSQPGDQGADQIAGSVSSRARAEQFGAAAGLSPRESRVIALIAQGLSNEEIATRDFLSVNSVKSYVRTAYRKIGVSSRTQAVVWALQHGFSTDGDSTTFQPSDGP